MSEPVYPNESCTHTFEEMATMVNDRVDDPSKADVEYYVGLEHLDSESLTIRRWGSPSEVEATKLRFRAGDIIFGRRRVYQRKLAVAHFDGICSAHAMVIRAKPDVVLPEFLPFFMQSDLFMERAKEISVGSLSPTINWKTLAKERFALPPLAQQRRVADALVASWETERANLDLEHMANEVRRSLAHLELTRSSSLFGVESNLHPLGEFVEFVPGHPFSSSDFVASRHPGALPLIRIRDLHDQAPGVYIAPGVAYPAEAVVRAGDLIVGMDGDFSCAVWTREPALLNQRMCKVVSQDLAILDAGYLHVWLETVLQRVTSLAGATTVRHVSIGELRGLGIAFPPIPVQQRVAQTITALRLLGDAANGRAVQARALRGFLVAGNQS